jgi:aspartate aminotransferase-like enzyme
MMGSDIHHRTEDFRRIYLSVLADLKEVMGTSNDVLALTASGTGVLEASITNLFSPGDRVVVCSAGKFGERWAEIAKAFGLDAIVLSEEYGGSVSARRLEDTLKTTPNVRGVFVQASETSTGAEHDVRAMGKAVQKTDAILVVDAITGLGTMPLDIDGWGLDVVIGGSQKAFMIPPGLAFLSISPKAWAFNENAKLPRYYFNLKKEKKNAANGESSWTPATSLVLALAEALKYVKSIGMDKLIANAQQLAAATRAAAAALNLELFSPGAPGSAVTAIQPPRGMDSGVIVKEFRDRFGSIIANGQGSMKGQIFRIAHLGYFDFADLFAVIPVKFGTGVAAVQNAYADVAVAKEAVPV